ncbi:alpha/beta hydrolase [Bryobacter aggregatus]|uniref:alpha/beta hydrolase n=1 Tax=Bryobacter aggregatus TaxID=360054 RepID=UPI00068D545B|nr:alpha/beta hydrolase [Bryobacter aggregatus]
MLFFAVNAKGEDLRDVEYARVGDVSLQLDAALPGGERLAPAAILVHGGGWVRGDRRVNVAPLFQPLTEAGIAWFSISYRFATGPLDFGAAVGDVEAAIRYVRHHAAEYRIDPNQIFLVGESAGGHLAAMAALGGAPGTAVKGVVALYAPTDLVALAKNSNFIPDGIRRQLNGSPFEKLILARLEQLSPVGLVRSGMPPFLFIHGMQDALVPFGQSQAMCERMKAVGAACRLLPVEGAGHGIVRWEGNREMTEGYQREMVRWILGTDH